MTITGARAILKPWRDNALRANIERPPAYPWELYGVFGGVDLHLFHALGGWRFNYCGSSGHPGIKKAFDLYVVFVTGPSFYR